MSKLISAELVDETRQRWKTLPFRYQQEILELPFVRRFLDARIYLLEDVNDRDIDRQLERKLREKRGQAQLMIIGTRKIGQQAQKPDALQLQGVGRYLHIGRANMAWTIE